MSKVANGNELAMIHLGTINEDEEEESQKSEKSFDAEAESVARKKMNAKEILKVKEEQSKNSIGIAALADYFGLQNQNKLDEKANCIVRKRPLGLGYLTSSEEENEEVELEYGSEEEAEKSRKVS